MPQDDRLEDIVIAAALTEFSAQYEQTDPELAAYAKQLANQQLVMHDWDGFGKTGR